MIKQRIYPLLIGIITIALAACAAGGGETGTGQTSQTDTITVGIITGFGSVFVNGVEYETDTNTNITLDDAESIESNLKVGMIVTLTGSINANGTTGSALSITFNDNVEGMVISNTVATDNQLIILGQTIIIDPFDTVFDSEVLAIKTIEQIQIDNIVEVSGHSDGNGTIYATRIHLKKQSRADGDEIEVKGLVANVTLAATFDIGNLTIDFNAATQENFNGASIQNGDFIEVKSNSGLNASNQLIASSIKLIRQNEFPQESSDKEIELEGIITNVKNSTEFSLNGQTIIINSATTVNNPNALIVGKKASIEGMLNSSAQIIASRVNIETDNKVKVEGLITAINPTNRTITVQGNEIYITNNTTVKDDREGIEDEERQFFNFNRLQENFQVTVSYFRDTESNHFIASKLELEDNENESQQDSAKGNEENEGDGENKNDENNKSNEDPDSNVSNESGNNNGNSSSDTWEIKNTITSYNPEAKTIVMLDNTIDITSISDLIDETVIGQTAEVNGVIVDNVWIATELEIISNEAEEDSSGFIENTSIDKITITNDDAENVEAPAIETETPQTNILDIQDIEVEVDLDINEDTTD